MNKIFKSLKSLVSKISRETATIAWTLGGTALVLITLSGPTQQIAIYITIGAGILHFAGVLIPYQSTDDEPKDGGNG